MDIPESTGLRMRNLERMEGRKEEQEKKLNVINILFLKSQDCRGHLPSHPSPSQLPSRTPMLPPQVDSELSGENLPKASAHVKSIRFPWLSGGSLYKWGSIMSPELSLPAREDRPKFILNHSK